MKMDSELGAVVDLMARSRLHQSYTVLDMQRLVVPPIELRQRSYVVDRGAVVAWGSWAFFNDRVEKGFIDATRKIQSWDWPSPGNIWLVDAIAPYGHARQLTSLIRAKLRETGHQGEYIYFRRTVDGNRRYSKALL